MNQKTFEGDNYVVELNKARLMGLVSFLIKTDQVKIIRNVPSKVMNMWYLISSIEILSWCILTMD